MLRRCPGSVTNIRPHWCTGHPHTHQHTQTSTTLDSRPSLPPVFDRLQYAKTEGEGLVNLDLAFCTSYEDDGEQH